VAEDVASADASGVAGTPTFFINGRRHQGAYDIDTLTDAVSTARRMALLRGRADSQPELAGRA
jgi:protein-disulfide isomerase